MLQFIFKNTVKMTELILPVTPSSFEIDTGIRIETINIHTVGDVNLAGLKSLSTIKVDCLLPARAYPFALSSQIIPYEIVATLQEWSDQGHILRFIISETPVNIPVIIENVAYGERDGSGDVYASLTLREYRYLTLPTYYTDGGTSQETREVENLPDCQESYTIVSGDTLSGICQKFYGDASLYAKLAAANQIQNPNLIYAGDVIHLPSRENL